MTVYFTDKAECDDSVQQLLNRLIDLVTSELHRQLISIYLRGSLARGEGVWKIVDGQAQILSDIDVLLVTVSRSSIPKSLLSKIHTLQNEFGLKLELRVIPFIKFSRLPMNLDVIELRNETQLLQGKDVLGSLPGVRSSPLGKDEIIFSAINEAILSIEEVSPSSFIDLTAADLEDISHRAVKTILRTGAMICLGQGFHARNYASLLESITAEQLDKFAIEPASYLRDLKAAYQFRYTQPHLEYLVDAEELWFRGRGYLVTLFNWAKSYTDDDGWQFENPENYGVKVGFWKYLRMMPMMIRFVLQENECSGVWKTFFTGGSVASVLQSSAYYAYLALGHPIDLVKLAQAESLIFGDSKIDHDMSFEGSEERWARIRDKLVKFHLRGLF